MLASVVCGFGNSNYTVQKATLGSGVFQTNNSFFKMESTVLHNIVYNSSNINYSFCLGYYCIQPESKLGAVIMAVEGGPGGGLIQKIFRKCPPNYKIVSFEGNFYCASLGTIQKYRNKTFMLYLGIGMFIILLFFWFWKWRWKE
jgi:hypothetical protein